MPLSTEQQLELDLALLTVAKLTAKIENWIPAATQASWYQHHIFFPIQTRAGKLQVTFINVENRADRMGRKVWVDVGDLFKMVIRTAEHLSLIHI